METQRTVCFLQGQAQIHLLKITDDTTKHYDVDLAIDQHTLCSILVILQNTSITNIYASRKTRLLATFSISREGIQVSLLHLEDP